MNEEILHGAQVAALICRVITARMAKHVRMHFQFRPLSCLGHDAVHRVARDGKSALGEPKRGELVIFRGEADPDTSHVDRTVGLPGDEITMTGGVVSINGFGVPRVPEQAYTAQTAGVTSKTVSRYWETWPGGAAYSVFESDPARALDTVPPIKVPAGWYYVLGDNRDNPVDSRTAAFGMIPADNRSAGSASSTSPPARSQAASPSHRPSPTSAGRAC